MMKNAVHFGAGKIGRGFIADLLHDSGYSITFLDTFEPVVEELKKNKSYPIFLIDHDYQEKDIDQVTALSSIKEPDAAVEAIADAEVITTSVMATNLPKIAPLLARGLKRRLEKRQDRAIVMACENAILGTDILKFEVRKTGILTDIEMDASAVWPNVAVDRMVFSGEHHGKQGIDVGDAIELPIERNKLVDPESQPIKGAEYVDDLMKYLQRKIYVVNCGHACTGFIGYHNGCPTIQETLARPELKEQIRNIALESAAAIEAEYGFAHDDMVRYVDSMIIKRYTTPGISDPVGRVCREPLRKLSANDRLMGPAILADKHGIPTPTLLYGIACALHYDDPDDEQTVAMQQMIDEMGIDDALTEITGIGKGTKLHKDIVAQYHSLA